MFILSMRGDTIITKDFTRELKRGTNEIFFRKVNADSEGEEVPPIFNVDGIKRSVAHLIKAVQHIIKIYQKHLENMV